MGAGTRDASRDRERFALGNARNLVSGLSEVASEKKLNESVEVATTIAAVTKEHLPLRVKEKAGVGFTVQRAQSDKLTARLSQRSEAPGEFYKINATAKILETIPRLALGGTF